MAVTTTDSCELLGRFLTSERAESLHDLTQEQATAVLELAGIAEHINSEIDLLRADWLYGRAADLTGVWSKPVWIVMTFMRGVAKHGGFRCVDPDDPDVSDEDIPIIAGLVERIPPEAATTVVRLMAYMAYCEESAELGYRSPELIRFVADEMGVEDVDSLVESEIEIRESEPSRPPWAD